MTEKLYQHETYLRELDARIVKDGLVDGRPAVVLDRTIFYPTSGGQMHDTGEIMGVPVVDVQSQADEIWHVLERMPEVKEIHAVLNWQRRFDFMQQHTGFHLLAGAFYQRLGIRTLAAHLGEESSTIEVEAEELAPETVEEIEVLANKIVWENRVVSSRFVTAAEIEAMPLRKAPQVEGLIRLVEIENFDLDPCGGTHVSTTGQVGLIKIIGRERIRQGLRFTFLAGERALRLVQRQHRLISALSLQLTTDEGSLLGAFQKLQNENKALRKNLQQQTQLQAEQTLASLCAAADERRTVVHIFENADLELVRFLAASALRRRPGRYLFAGRTARASLVFCSNASGIDLRPAFAAAMAAVGGRGGGEALFVQGSGTRIDKIEEALSLAEDIVEKGNKTIDI